LQHAEGSEAGRRFLAVQAKLGSAMETQPAVQQNRDAGRFSNSEVEVDSPFASKSLPKEVLPSCSPSGSDPELFHTSCTHG